MQHTSISMRIGGGGFFKALISDKSLKDKLIERCEPSQPMSPPERQMAVAL
eukprot:CAMPEP_0177203440 /NCGR_PEP_ID=MMETSP0367-20130122/27817_1 /TAXON_ID=447022 ORGANISM="Scrippsiella hangoei-like, Strain SHHI-4" /NCGR_SAMPLE_ID=MMETSP0367 /ASSEMBLY_ACC=CAM_ASM_000362 /LENGTH=50 /DNA_ID=CAMNT_0018652073 /DNA_START=337 /DNA_END=489 /DNA_ORIENTATION=+